MLAGPQRDARLQHGIDVEIVAVQLTLQPDGAPNVDAANQLLDPIAQHLRTLERILDQAGITLARRHFAHAGPFRTFDTLCAIPFRIGRDHVSAPIRGDGPGATVGFAG